MHRDFRSIANHKEFPCVILQVTGVCTNAQTVCGTENIADKDGGEYCAFTRLQVELTDC